MIVPIKHLPVNWIDGMKISRQHFVDSDNHVADAIRDSISIGINRNNYGLLPYLKERSNSLDLEILDRASDTLEVNLRHCNAVTIAGVHVYLSADEEPLSCSYTFDQLRQLSADSKVSYLFVVLTADPFDRLPAGQPDADAVPLRHPYSVMQCKLQVVPGDHVVGSALGAHHFVVGKIFKKNDKYVMDEYFVPPSTAIISHRILVGYFERLGGALNDLQQYSIQIVDKIASRPDRQNNYSKAIHNLCERVLTYIATIYYSYRNMAPQQPPVHTVGYFSSLAHIVHTSLQLLGHTEKEELLQYFHVWKNDSRPGEFEDMIKKTVEITYDHSDLIKSFIQVEEFITNLNALWKIMVNLEHIGKPKEGIIVTEKEMVVKAPKTSWTTLD